MLADSVLLGDVTKEPYDLFVYRACREAAGLPLFALSLYPDGTVWAEPVEEAAPEDLVGCSPRPERTTAQCGTLSGMRLNSAVTA